MLKGYFSEKVMVEAGCDEAGRGCLAGPVVAAAVILPRNFSHKVLNDSKQLSRTQREEMRLEVLDAAVDYAIAEVSNEEIDQINILNASFLAMHRALDHLKVIPELLLIDGNRFNPYGNIKHECIIEGDGLYFSIAAASILAKTHRDQLMWKWAENYPGYGWETNVGYATRAHRKALKELGPTPLHRKSFRLIANQLELF
ncbi:MAG: ribonuclease HII [Candidatus Cyclobacteriaceae bacterium M3_2C_046]